MLVRFSTAGLPSTAFIAREDPERSRRAELIRPCASTRSKRSRIAPNLRLQYLAGLGLNLYQADVIYADMLKHVNKLPDDLFIATDATKASLFAAINRAQGR